jgi:hypothetical protein
MTEPHQSYEKWRQLITCATITYIVAYPPSARVYLLTVSVFGPLVKYVCPRHFQEETCSLRIQAMQ